MEEKEKKPLSSRPSRRRLQNCKQETESKFSPKIIAAIAILALLIYSFSGEEKKPEPEPEKKKQVKYSIDPANQATKIVCQKLASITPVSQDILNESLKILHNDQYNSESADIHNLTARLYWYKIFLDQENKYFESEWKDKWLQLAETHFQKAKELYKSKQVRSNIRLTVQKWMPEYKLYPGMTMSKNTKVTFKTPLDAIEDMEFLLSKLHTSLQRE